jgi:hypothetical protein
MPAPLTVYGYSQGPVFAHKQGNKGKPGNGEDLKRNNENCRPGELISTDPDGS